MGFIENTQGTLHVERTGEHPHADDGKRSGVSRFFYSSSACVYAADKQTNPNVTALKEEDAYPAMPEDGYGWEKLFSERMCRHFREDLVGNPRCALSRTSMGRWGPMLVAGRRHRRRSARQVIEAKLSGNHEIEIWGDGHQTRSFMWIDDCVKGTQMIMDSGFRSSR